MSKTIATRPSNATRGKRRTKRFATDRPSSIGLALIAALLAGTGFAHHAVDAKFDDGKPLTLNGIVTSVDWRNPHVHVFVNVATAGDQAANWAVELASPITLQKSGWQRESLQPGDGVTVEGIVARDGTRQIWGDTVVHTATGRRVLHSVDPAPLAFKAARPTSRWSDGRPRLGAPDSEGGYWAYPTATTLVEEDVNVRLSSDGLLRDIDDAERVAPLKPWALGVYEHRQLRKLRDDPTFLNCKPPGGVRHFQSQYGVQFVEDRSRRRIFVLIGSGNHNYRIIYLDERDHQGQVRGDDDNPLYYGRSVGRWEDDTLVVQTRGFNEDFWFTNGGLPHTDQLSLTERFTRPEFDTLRYEVTIDDPGAYTRPWSSSWELRWVGGDELPAHFCQDNRS